MSRINRGITLNPNNGLVICIKINHSETLASSLEFNFSSSFTGTVWKMVALPPEDLLLLEIRDEDNRQVSFFALHYSSNTFLWKDLKPDDSWWSGLLAAYKSVFLVQNYTNQDNPDATKIIAFDVHSSKFLWEHPSFSFSSFIDGNVLGTSQEDSNPLLLDLFSGEVLKREIKLDSHSNEIYDPLRPFQYQEGTDYYGTVSTFLSNKFNVKPEGTVEYQEYDDLIFISYYMRDKGSLLNYLLVLNDKGHALLHEKIGEQLKGLGLDTFFILSGCLFFVRNKRELLSYRIL